MYCLILSSLYSVPESFLSILDSASIIFITMVTTLESVQIGFISNFIVLQFALTCFIRSLHSVHTSFVVNYALMSFTFLVYQLVLLTIRYYALIALLAILYIVQIDLKDYRNFLFCKGKFYQQLCLVFGLVPVAYWLVF